MKASLRRMIGEGWLKPGQVLSVHCGLQRRRQLRIGVNDFALDSEGWATELGGRQKEMDEP
jgi:hypothetical protein